MKEVVEYLAARPEPLASTLTAEKENITQRTKQPHKKRRVVLGTVPAYDYTGKGVRLDGVTTGSPADKAGLHKGDIIVNIGETIIEDLETFSDVLKTLQAGNEITIVFKRNNIEHSVTTKVVAR